MNLAGSVEHLGRAPRGGAMDPHPGTLRTPGGDPGLGVFEVGEPLSGPEVCTDVLHGTFDPRLVLRGPPDPGWVGREPDMLGVVQPARREPWVDRVGGGDHGLE